MMTGEFSAAAVSMAALTVSVPVQLTAGMAKPCALAYANTFCTPSPLMTPGGTISFSVDIGKYSY